MRVRRGLVHGRWPIGCLSAALIAGVASVPAAATPGPAVTYHAGVTLECVDAPGVLNLELSVPLSLTGDGPGYVQTGDSFSLTNAAFTLAVPNPAPVSFVDTGAADVAGDVTSFPVDATNATPSSIDPTTTTLPFSTLNVMNFGTAKGKGLPFGPVADASDPLNLAVPVQTTPITITSTSTTYDAPNGTRSTFGVGPFAVTGQPGSISALSIDTAPAFSTAGAGNFTVLTGGVALQVAGYADASLNLNTTGEKKAGPLGMYCNAPTNTLGSVPIVSNATVSSPSDQAVTPGATATFSVTTGGEPGPTVQWQVSADNGTTWSNDTTDAGNTTTTLSVVGSSSNNGDLYRAAVTNSVSNPAATPPGPYTISTVDSAGAKLTVNATSSNAPVVSAVWPGTGGSYSLVLITGKRFGGAEAVKFGARPALFLRLSSGFIIALAPPAPAGTVDVTVRTTAGTSAISSADKFTYTGRVF